MSKKAKAVFITRRGVLHNLEKMYIAIFLSVTSKWLMKTTDNLKNTSRLSKSYFKSTSRSLQRQLQGSLSFKAT